MPWARSGWSRTPNGSRTPPPCRSGPNDRPARSHTPIRVHDDPVSRGAVAAIHAGAATHGPDIHLGATAPDLASPAGERLLWHELTHVVQQGGGGDRALLSAPGDPHERQAEAVASGLVAPASVVGGPAPALQRQEMRPVPSSPPVRGLPPGFRPTTIQGPDSPCGRCAIVGRVRTC